VSLSRPWLPTGSKIRFSRYEIAAWSLWAILFIGCSMVAYLTPGRSVTGIYRQATQAWWAGQKLYTPEIHGFLYFPASAIFYTPFAFLPPVLGDFAWRSLSVVLLLSGVVRLARLIDPANARSLTATALWLALAVAGVNVLRAQTEVAMIALMMHATVDIAGRRWIRGALLLAIATGLKPLALVPLLLFGAVYRPLRLWLVLGLTAVLLLPFLYPDWSYVVSQYGDLVTKLMIAANPGSGRWNDVSMLLARCDIVLPGTAMTVLRLGVATGIAILAHLARRRYPEREAAFLVLLLSVCYLLLFNPRTELGSYLNIALPAGLMVGLYLLQGRHYGLATLLALFCLGLGTHSYGDWIYRPTDVWLKPALCLAFLTALAVSILRGTAFSFAPSPGAALPDRPSAGGAPTRILPRGDG
jgi:hypothetical protein